MILVMMLAATLLFPFVADAACTGAGPTWSCPAGTTIAEIETAYASGTDGMVITFEPGSYTWNTGILDTFTDAKGVTLICSVAETCDVALSLALFLRIEYSGTNTWTVHYTPYTYPHPLQGFVAGSGAGLRGSKGMGLF